MWGVRERESSSRVAPKSVASEAGEGGIEIALERR